MEKRGGRDMRRWSAVLLPLALLAGCGPTLAEEPTPTAERDIWERGIFDEEGYAVCRELVDQWMVYYGRAKSRMGRGTGVSATCRAAGFMPVGENLETGLKAYLLQHDVIPDPPGGAMAMAAGGEGPDEAGNIPTLVMIAMVDGVPIGVRTLWETPLDTILEQLEQGDEDFYINFRDPVEELAILEEEERAWEME